ncbi:MAG: hypothetical protein BYD32DRAFT_412639 [Podila humilis]|nr:MAG: hypothetical protein BYD32DRAFT_412639 [Podila humilis]
MQLTSLSRLSRLPLPLRLCLYLSASASVCDFALRGSSSPFNGCCACGLKITRAQRQKKWHPPPHCDFIFTHSHSHSALLSCVWSTPSLSLSLSSLSPFITVEQ